MHPPVPRHDVGMLRSAIPLALVFVLLQSADIGPPPFAAFVRSLDGDARRLGDEVASVYAASPRDPGVLYYVGYVYAQAGRTDEALSALRAMRAAGGGLHPRPHRGFESLADHPEFRRLLDRIREENPPVGNARSVFELEEGDLIPEGIAWSGATERFYLGSLKRKIVSVSRTGEPREFVRTADHGLGVVLGIRVDDRRGDLWAVSGWIGDKPPDAVAGLFRYRLSDGAFVRSYEIAGSERDLLNDVVVAPDGTVFATASNSGALVRLDPVRGTHEELLPGGALPDPNGITITSDGQSLFVAGWYTIARVDVKTRAVHLLRKEPWMAVGCIDGLYLTGPRELTGIQNCVHESGRVLRIRLDRDLERIDAVDVLESYNPLFEGITTAAPAGRDLYFVANTQMRRAGPPYDPIRVLRLALDAPGQALRKPSRQ